MRLKNLLPHIYSGETVNLYYMDANDKAHDIYNGYVEDVPWKFINLQLDSSNNEGAIAVNDETITICVKNETFV